VKQPLIEIHGFSYSVGSKTILDGLSLDVFEGEYLSIIGPNGAGKTTLLKCLMRINTGGTGEIRLRGKALGRYRQKELAVLMSYVPQSDGRSLPFTVEEYVMMGRYPHLSPFTPVGVDDREAVRHALDLTGAAEFADRHMDTLSGGERQTVSIASVLAQGARVLLLDEPTTFLDPRHVEDILGILNRINCDLGITIVSVTHDINNAALHSDRIAVIKNGALIFCDRAGKVMDNTILSRVYDTSFNFVRHPASGMPIIVPGGGES